MLICTTVEDCPCIMQCWSKGDGCYDVSSSEDRAKGVIRITRSIEGCDLIGSSIKMEDLNNEIVC